MSHVHAQRLAAIREEYQAVESAVAYAAQEWNTAHRNDIFRAASVQIAQINRARQRLSDTYIVRAFSEFEAILRETRQASGGRVPNKAEALINRAASRGRIPNRIRDNAHTVRAYRNAIVHQNAAIALPQTFETALSSLNRFAAAL